MDYFQRVDYIVKKSGLTLNEIVDKCKQNGVSIDPSYISKLRSGKQPAPASDEINIALSNACGVDPDDLLFDAYIEKAPELIKTLISNFLKYIRYFIKDTIKREIPKDLLPIYEKQLDDLSDRDITKQIISENISEIFSYREDNTFIIPDESDNKLNIVLNPIFGLTMKDDSMSPIIPEGAALQLDNPKKVKSGDIVLAVFPNKNKYYVRRYVPVDKKIVLIAENSSFAPLTLDKKSVIIVAKVKSYLKELGGVSK